LILPPVGPCRTLAQAQNLGGGDGISCAVLDVRLNQETSLPVARQLKERGIPFVFLTRQLHTDHLLAEWQDAKIISKPFHRRAILVAVADMLEAGK
jgi:DNA-binding response OmpR family regulator